MVGQMVGQTNGLRDRTGSGVVDRTETTRRDLGDYMPLVRQIAAQVAGSIPRHVELNELVSAGSVGLVEAARRFDPDRGVRFEAYVAERIRGSIIDFLRSLDWAPRSVRSNGKRIEEARTRLCGELGRPATDDEVAEAVGLSPDDVRAVQSSLSTATVLTLDRSAGDDDDGDGDSVAAGVSDDSAPLPDEILERKELCGYLADAVNCLPEQARTVIGLYYIEGMQMSEIGSLLGVTQSRASQIHSAALTLLRDAIRAQLDPESAPDHSNPKGRRARRLSRFHTAVAGASDWKSRLGDGHRKISVDLERMIGDLEDRHAQRSDEFLAEHRAGNTEGNPDAARWALLLDRSQQIRDKQDRKLGSLAS